MKRRYIFLMLFVGAAWLYLSAQQDSSQGSTYSARYNGSKAFFLLLKKQGFQVEYWLRPFGDMSGEDQNAAMIIISPHKAGGGAELREWVAQGNSLLVFGKAAIQAFKLTDLAALVKSQALALSVDRLRLLLEKKDVKVQCPSALSDVCGSVNSISQSPESLNVNLEKGSILAGEAQAAKLLYVPHGKGEIWFFAGNTPITNMYIDRADNLKLLYQILQNKSKILFDEFHHGHSVPLEGEVERRWNVVLLLASYLLIILLFGAASRMLRFGPPLPRSKEQPSGSVDFASVLGLLYRDNDARTILRQYLSSWRLRLEKHFGISSRLPDELLLEELLKQGLVSEKGLKSFDIALRSLKETSAASEEEWQTQLTLIESVFRTSVSGVPRG